MDELDRYADALTTFETINGVQRIRSAGFMPLVPGWYIAYTTAWFGGKLFDEERGRLLLTTEPVVRAFDWIAGYSRRYGKSAVTDFRSGMGDYASAQSPFLIGAVAMEYQGPWMNVYIEQHAPQLNRAGLPADELAREKAFPDLRDGLSVDALIAKLGMPSSRTADAMT